MPHQILCTFHLLLRQNEQSLFNAYFLKVSCYEHYYYFPRSLESVCRFSAWASRNVWGRQGEVLCCVPGFTCPKYKARRLILSSIPRPLASEDVERRIFPASLPEVFYIILKNVNFVLDSNIKGLTRLHSCLFTLSGFYLVVVNSSGSFCARHQEVFNSSVIKEFLKI